MAGGRPRDQRLKGGKLPAVRLRHVLEVAAAVDNFPKLFALDGLQLRSQGVEPGRCLAAHVLGNALRLGSQLRNAVKHAPPGSELTVRLVSDGHIDGHIAALTITDAGSGIAPELRERLFQPFATGRRHAGTGSGAPADLRHGAGLGLAICQEIVQSLGGTLQLDNRESHGRVLGLEATVRLPLAG